MPNPTSVLSSESTSGSAVYRPLSGAALAGFVLAAGYAALFTILGVVALWLKSPLMGPWTLVIPILGAVLCLLGRRQIRRSEGSRSGAALAVWGLRLSLLFGFGYLAFYLGVYVAVSMQAKNFVEKWFEKVRQGQLNEAFLDALDPLVSLNDNPKDETHMRIRYGTGESGGKGPLLIFGESEIVRLLQQNESTIKPMGIRALDYKNAGYQVELTYHLTSPEGLFEVVVPVRRKESSELRGGRRWHVLANETRLAEPQVLYLSTLGTTVKSWRTDARNFGSKWLVNLALNPEQAFHDTLPPDKRRAVSEDFNIRWLSAVLGAGADSGDRGVAASAAQVALVLFPDLAQRQFASGYTAFADFAWLKSDKFQVDRELRDQRIPEQFKTSLFDLGLVSMQIGKQAANLRPRLIDRDRMEIQADVQIRLNPIEGISRPRFALEGVLVLESDPGPMLPTRVPNWTVKHLELVRGGIVSQQPGRGGADDLTFGPSLTHPPGGATK